MQQTGRKIGLQAIRLFWILLCGHHYTVILEILLRYRDILSQILHQRITGILGKPFTVRKRMADLPLLDPPDRLIRVGHLKPCNRDDFLRGPYICGTEYVIINAGFSTDPFQDIHGSDCLADSSSFVRPRVLAWSGRKDSGSIRGFFAKQLTGYMLVIPFLRIVSRCYFIDINVSIRLQALDTFYLGITGRFFWAWNYSFLFSAYILP